MPEPTDTTSVLRSVFGFADLREGQQEVITSLLEERPALAIFPTGGGKSLCYQLPALMLDGTALVVSPLLALMKDQVDSLVAKGVAAARLDSTLDINEYAAVSSSLRKGELKLLYISPEKLCNPEFQKFLKGLHISLIAVDEAHCISEWGHNFRPDYLKLGKIFRKLKVKRLLALTATATPKVAMDIRKQFRIAKADHVQLSFHRGNLDLQITPCTSDERKPLLLETMEDTSGAGIIYVTRQETAEEVATFLAKNGHSARAYHAGLRSDLRREIQEAFMLGETEIVVATIAFGMGVDKANIRRVIHYNLPKSIEGYTQEIGRAGRDGQPAICKMLACAEDTIVLENFIFSDTPGRQALRNLLERLMRLGSGFDISFYDLATTADIRQTVIEILFARLEMKGMLEAGESFWETYRIKLLQPLIRVLAGRPASEKKLLEKIFENHDAEWKWLSVKIPDVAERLGTSPQKLRALISAIEAACDVTLKRSGWRHAYKLKNPPQDLNELIDETTNFFQERELADLAKLQQVLRLASTRTCLTKFLLKHFGEKMEQPCGHCDRCRGIPPKNLKAKRTRSVKASELEEIRNLHDTKLPALSSARQMARFLCGMSSPASMRARLYRNDAYGMLKDLPFEEVLLVAESQF
ncbi:ATP-dependent DNA helicase RecQ [Luteolibacter sp. AS25]|uniref:RecQ family ATP-dependent DNA helicase n=1 Tax=Luteolibacter sp. AS25 TaxID=3135776 RepID=UPI00398B3262